jgi:cell division septal protein FtsQ
VADTLRMRRKTLALGYIALCALALAAALMSPAASIRRVRLSGIDGLPPAEREATIRAAAIRPGTNWLRAPVSTVGGRIRALPWVGSADVHRTLPFGLGIDVQARKPVVVAEAGGAMWELDSTGTPIRAADAASQQSLPHIVLPAGRVVRPGAPIGDEAVARCIHALLFDQPQLPVRIAKIDVDLAGDICLNMSDGLPILFGQPDDFDVKLALVKKLYKRQPDIAKRLASVNLSTPAWPAAVPIGASSAGKPGGEGAASVQGAPGSQQPAATSRQAGAGGRTPGSETAPDGGASAHAGSADTDVSSRHRAARSNNEDRDDTDRHRATRSENDDDDDAAGHASTTDSEH